MKSKTYLLSDLGKFKNGLNFNRNDYGTTYPIINVKHLYNSRFTTSENLPKLSNKIKQNLTEYFVKKNDLLFARGSMVTSGAGQVAMVNDFHEGTVFSGFIIRLRLNDEKVVLPLYLNYLLRSPKFREMFIRIAEGSVHSNFTQELLGNIKVELPKISIQKKIIDIIGKLDDQIELLKTNNIFLEKIIQNIFKSWFVHFDTISEFEDTKLGKIPKGWSIKNLGELINHKKGFAFKSKDYRKRGHPIIRVSNFIDHTIDMDKCYFIEVHDALKFESVKLLSNDIIITTVGSGMNHPDSLVGKVIRVPIIANDALLNQNAVRLRANINFIQNFLFYYFIINDFQTYLIKRAQGSANQASIPLKTIFDFPIIFPTKEILKNFETNIKCFIEKISLNELEIQKIKIIRESLLPKLLSGEIKV